MRYNGLFRDKEWRVFPLAWYNQLMKTSSNYEVLSTLNKATYPESIPYEKIKDHYLGKGYELSLVFCGEKLMRRLNKESRNKDYATNILSFPFDETSGEIFICIPVCKKQYKKFDRSFSNFIAFLFTHGLVHLNGHDHGDTMDSEEERLRKRFKI